jgi:hypothetical protein
MFAGTITQTCTLSLEPLGTLTSCTFQQFNESLGTLTDVALSLSGVNGTENAGVTNTSSTSNTFSNLAIHLSVTYSDSTVGASVSLTTPTTSPACAGTVAGNVTQYCDGTNGSTNDTTTFSGLSASENPVPGGSAWTAYQSFTPGTIAGTFSGQALVNQDTGTAPAADFTGGEGTLAGVLTLTYTYSGPAPEPGSMLLVGGALLGIGFAFRKQQRKS